jgi:hypothetical protein
MMPTTREFSLSMKDQPGTLGKICQALADRGVNILAFQAMPCEGKNLVRFVVDNPTTAKSVLDTQKLPYKEMEVVQAKFPHRPGELARAASQLGEANINIDHAYSGLDPGTNAPVLIFGVAEAGRAAKILDKTAAAAAG